MHTSTPVRALSDQRQNGRSPPSEALRDVPSTYIRPPKINVLNPTATAPARAASSPAGSARQQATDLFRPCPRHALLSRRHEFPPAHAPSEAREKRRPRSRREPAYRHRTKTGTSPASTSSLASRLKEIPRASDRDFRRAACFAIPYERRA